MEKDVVEKDAIREQLERILEHPAFKNTMRCHKFLDYVVKCSLNGDGHLLKERTLGIEVFGRDACYDTSQDTVVRATAGDVRKRITRYYHEPGHEAEIRIDLPLGSYVPEFHNPAEVETIAEMQDASKEPDSSLTLNAVSLFDRNKLAWLICIVTILGILICAIVWISYRKSDATPSLVTATGLVEPIGALMEKFWQPLIAQPAPILICIGDSDPLLFKNRPPRTGAAAPFPAKPVSDRIARKDVIAIARITGFVSRLGRPYLIKTASSTTLEDLSQGSSILIGEYDLAGRADNDRIMRATKALRFHFVSDVDSDEIRIVDSKNPDKLDWYFNFSTPPSESKKDFSIIARYIDASTGRWIIVVAGMGTNATAAAASVILDTRSMDNMLMNISGDWTSRNIEAVISTPHENGELGPISVLAVEIW